MIAHSSSMKTKSMPLWTVFCLVVVGLRVGEAQARMGRAPSVGAEIQVADEGVSFRGLRHVRAVPLRPPEVYRYRTSDGSVAEMFDPRDLWYATQYRGRWEDERGNAMVFGVIDSMMPTGFPREHVLRQDFDRAFQGSKPPTGGADWAKWVEEFSGVGVRSPPERLPQGPRLQSVARFDLESTDRPRLGYAFNFVSNIHGVDEDQWFFLLFEFAVGTDRQAARHVIEREILGSLQPIPRTETARPSVAQRFQSPDTAVGDVSPERAESRGAALNSIRGMPGWWHVETPQYILVSNLSGAERALVRGIQEDLNALREVWERMIPPRRPIEAISVVRVFADGEEYVEYVGEENRWTGGIWMPRRRELVIRPQEHGRARDRREHAAGLVNHEAFHQYVFYAFDAVETSVWYNEGHAVFFEPAEFTRDGLRINENDRYVSVVESVLGGRDGGYDVRELLKKTDEEFYLRQAVDRGPRRQNYAMAWALIYYLRKAAPLEGDNDYEKILDRYADALWQTRNADQATRLAFEGVDMDAFNRNFKAFWDSRSRRTWAWRNNPF